MSVQSVTNDRLVQNWGGNPSIGTMTLADLLSLYLTTRETGTRYRESLARTVKKAGMAGCLSVADLTPGVVNRFLVGLSSLTPTTKSNVRRELLTLWRYAYEEGLTEVPPLRVVRIKCRPTAPNAWHMSTMSSIVNHAETDTTLVRHGMRICDWLPCWITVAYDTGLRFEDVRNLRIENIENGLVITVARKTGKRAVRRLSGYAKKSAEALGAKSPDGTLFAWFLTRRRAFLTVRAFLNRHHIGGSLKYLRRSCATYIEATRPGEATRYLQHSTASVTARHYVDESLLAVPCGPPPIR